MDINNIFNGEIIFSSKHKTVKATLRAAIKAKADLRGASLREADLRGANLREADLREADLQGANLRGANLQWADLRGANLQEADLQGANLQEANLQGANLQGADLDFSSGLFFGCKSFNIKADLRLAAQIAYHFCKIDFDCDDAKEAQKSLTHLANKFHRVNECGVIE